jgi:hypothetical protein
MRRLTEEQSAAVVAKYRPQRCRFKWFKHRNWAKAYAQAMTDGCAEIGTVYPDTPFMALVFLHECAHVTARDIHLPNDHPTHTYEYAAERAAMCHWRNEGHKVPGHYIKTAKRYIRGCIERDRKKGHKIKPHVARWAGK